MEKRILSHDSFSLECISHGEGVTALVIGSSRYYQRTFEKITTPHIRFIYADIRVFAHHKTQSAPSDFTLDSLISDIETVRAAYKLDSIILIGHSIHAFLALEYGRRYPHYVSQVVVIAASPFVGPRVYEAANTYFNESVCPERKLAFADSMKNFSQNPHPSFIDRMLAFGPMIWNDYTYDAAWLWKDVSVDPVGGTNVWGDLFSHYDTEAALRSLSCPLFIALGRYDYFNPPHLWEPFRTAASDLTMRIFEKSGHTPQLEEASFFEQELLSFLKLANLEG